MEKAYDPKELVKKLERKGLVVVEDLAVVVLDATLEWLQESAAMTPNPYDDILAALLPTLRKEALKHIDKIDGIENR
jgi:hypothetical protein